MSFGPVPGPIHAGDGSDSKLIFLGSEKGGNDLSISLGNANRDVRIKGDGTLANASDLLDGIKGAGSSLIAQSFGLNPALVNASLVMTQQSLRVVMMNVAVDALVTGIAFVQTIQGAYTPNNYNGVGLYSWDGNTTFTLIASSTNDGTTWSANTTNTFVKKDFSAQVQVAAGTYWGAILYNASAFTTAPEIASQTGIGTAVVLNTIDLPTGVVTYGKDDGRTSLPATFSTMAGTAAHPWLALY